MARTPSKPTSPRKPRVAPATSATSKPSATKPKAAPRTPARAVPATPARAVPATPTRAVPATPARAAPRASAKAPAAAAKLPRATAKSPAKPPAKTPAARAARAAAPIASTATKPARAMAPKPARPPAAGAATAPRTGAPRARKRPPAMAPDRLELLVKAAVASLEDDKAQDVRVLDVAGRASFTDRMIIATGEVDRQLQAMAAHLDEALGKQGLKLKRSAIEQSDDWVLIDAGDLVIHLFLPEARATFNLEKLWSGAAPVLGGDPI